MATTSISSLNSTLNSTIDGLYSQTGGKDVTLIGSHFKSALFVAPIVINAICAAVFLGLTIFSYIRGLAAKESRTAFVVMMTLLGGMTLSFLRSFANGMVHEYTPTVPSAFLILPAFKPIINSTDDVLLIGVIYRIIKNRNRWLTGGPAGYKTWQKIHRGVVSLLTLLAVADAVFYIYAQVLLFVKDTDDPKLEAPAHDYQAIHLTYKSVYAAVSLEILIGTAFLLAQTRRQHLQSWIVTYLATLISPWLLLRSIALLVVAIRYSYQAHTESRSLSVVETALWALPSVIIFTGLVLVQFNRGWFAQMKDDVAPAQLTDATWSPSQHGEMWKTSVAEHRERTASSS